MNVVLEGYKPLLMYTSPASIPQIVAHIQDYLIKNPIVSIETIAQIIVQALQEHPELLNGSVIPISEDSEQSIKAYIDSLPLVDGYTKAEINLLLSGKQDTLTFDQTPTPGSSNPVTSSGIIAAMSALQTALETMINLKADATSTYTKTQVDTKLLDKANVSDVYTKNTMDAKLLEINTNIDGIEDDIDGIQTDLSTQSQQIGDLTQLRTSAIDSLVNAINTTISTYTISGAVDFNSIPENGFYRIASSNASNNPNSDSTAFFGTLLNVKNNGYGMQLATITTSQGNPILYLRCTTTNTWTGMTWKRIDNVDNSIAYVINGVTYSGATIPSGSYVFWNGTLYTANGAIPAGSVSAANFTSLSKTGGLNSLAKDLLKTVTVVVSDLGALTAGSYGYKTVNITIPDGYVTTGITNIIKGHPAAGAGFNIIMNGDPGRKGTVTEGYTYQSLANISETYTDFKILLLCVKEM